MNAALKKRFVGWLRGLLLVCTTTLGHAQQAPFQNLGFESATFVSVPTQYSGSADPAYALPGWTARAGTNVVPYVLFGTLFLDSTGASIMAGSPNFGSPPEGSFMVLLQAGLIPPWMPGGPPLSWDRLTISISQIGFVPLDARSLTFQASSELTVSLDGQTLPVVSLGSNLYGSDITAFAGSIRELRITAYPPTGNTTDINNVTLDNIQFSSTPIPEPSFAIILVAGLISAILARRCSRQPTRPLIKPPAEESRMQADM